MIPKPGSARKRPLGIPTVRDRVVQTALRMVIEPIFEKEFAPHSYGFRPGRGCKDALRQVDALLKSGHVHVVDAGLKSYFDTIPHQRLMALVAERIADGRVLELFHRRCLALMLLCLLGWAPARAEFVLGIVPSGPRLERGFRVEPSKRYPLSLPSLGSGRIYDFRETAKAFGISMGSDEVLLYSPASQLIYYRMRPRNAELTRVSFGSHAPKVVTTYEVTRLVERGGKEGKRRLGVVLIPNGATRRFKMIPSAVVSNTPVEMELVFGPDGKTFDYTLRGSVRLKTEVVSLDGTGTSTLEKAPVVCASGKGSQRGESVVFTVKPRYTAEQLRFRLWSSKEAGFEGEGDRS